MNGSDFTRWLIQKAAAPVEPGIQHPDQLPASTAQDTLVPVQNQTVHGLAGKTYITARTPYLAPINHSVLDTHQQPHQQSPQTVNSDIPSAYLLPVQPITVGKT